MLVFLPTNLGAVDIAAEVYASVNTVKTHLRHIYPRLDAHSRGAGRGAGARARATRPLGATADTSLTRFVRCAVTRAAVTVLV